jgi:hypothetical protein
MGKINHMNNVVVFFKLLVGTTAGFFSGSDFDIQQINTNNPPQEIVSKLQKFEASLVYSFSDHEEFTIKHGLNDNYFTFFQQLGIPYYYTAVARNDKTVKKILDGQDITVQHKAGEIAGAVCAVLRTVKNKRGKKMKAWYICDLKVDPKYQGEHLPVTMVKKFALARFVQCPRGFAICMNPVTGDPKAASIFKKNGPISDIHTQTLNLYSLSAEQAQEQHDYIQSCLVKHGYMKKNMQLGLVATAGVKDYKISNRLTAQTRPWNLLHIKPSLKGFRPQESATHMVCAVEGTQLDNDFKKNLGSPSSTAQIVSYGMKTVDFNFLTSDQI